MQPKPAAFDCQFQPSTVFGRRSLQLGEEGPVDFLDMDPAVLNGFNRVCDLISLRAAASGSAQGRSVANFIR